MPVVVVGEITIKIAVKLLCGGFRIPTLTAFVVVVGVGGVAILPRRVFIPSVAGIAWDVRGPLARGDDSRVRKQQRRLLLCIFEHSEFLDILSIEGYAVVDLAGGRNVRAFAALSP